MTEETMFNEFLEIVDADLIQEIESGVRGRRIVWRYLADSLKPLNPREFLEFWGGLAPYERHNFVFVALHS